MKTSHSDADEHYLYIKRMTNIIINFKFISQSYTSLKTKDIIQIQPHGIDIYKENYKCLIDSMNRFVSTINEFGGLKTKWDTKDVNEAMFQIRSLHNELKTLVNTTEDNHNWLINTCSYDSSASDVVDTSDPIYTLVASTVSDPPTHQTHIPNAQTV